MSLEKPAAVQKARTEGDLPALKAMGHKGAMASAESKKLQKLFKEINQSDLANDNERAQLEQAKLYALSPEGDVLPPETPPNE